MKDSRPDFSKAVDRLLVEITRRVEAFSQVDPHSILVVAGSARDTSRATVRSLAGPNHPTVTVDGHGRVFEITLRPLFFLDANGLGRLVTLFHELYHLDVAGHAHPRLDPSRRHGAADGDFDDVVERWARGFAEEAPFQILAPLGHEGEVLVRQWRIRPAPGVCPTHFGDEHLFMGPVVMRTPARDRSGWW